ncbi:hypothetical protein [Nocardia puris]|uniref:Uncharacterized protein n=1 Tax=Nocardia puris TaxID=208602 RepID=A0A366DAH2_9NOCA|nr:hypothetical protein [Nocardia puris]RBO87023.1 hypothetical protein DFR74_112200 [Nocardia puris]
MLPRLEARAGTAYGAARLRDPEVVAALAAAKDDNPAPSIEGYTALSAALNRIENRLTQIAWIAAKSDPSTAPVAPGPEYPHLVLREQNRRADMRDLELQLIPEGG